MALRGAADDGSGAPLSRRTPGAAHRGPGKPIRPVLPDSVLSRMKAAVDAEHVANQGGSHDPDTEPLPRVTVSGLPSERGAKRHPSPSGVGPDSEVPPDDAAKSGGAAGPPRSADEQPRAEEQRHAEQPLRVAKALRAVEPDSLRAVEQEPLASVVPPAPTESDDPAEQDDWPPGFKQEHAPRAAFAATHDAGPTPGSIGWLWPEETATRGGGGRWRPPGSRRYRAVALAAAGAIILGGAGVAVGLSLHAHAVPVADRESRPKATARPSATPAATHSVAPATPAPDSGLALSTAAAATWITQQVAPGTYVACDAKTCAALTASGFPAYQEVQIGLGSQSLGNASMVVMTPELHTFFSVVNPSLGGDVTPVTLASFGQVSIQMISPDGASAFEAALSQDVQARMQLGEQLLNSGQVETSPMAESELAAGEVDSRLLLALQALAAQQPIDVLAFTDSGPGASQGIPFRAVDLAVTDPASGLTAAQYLHSLAQLLNAHANFPAYTKATPVMLPDGQRAAQIEYAAPSPLGLLTS